MSEFTRRQIIKGGGLVAAGWWGRDLWTLPASALTNPAGTTLESSIVFVGASGYRKLAAGPAYQMVVRTELAAPVAGRDQKRVAVASIVHLTDVHLIDCESPARVEFLDRYADPPTQSIPFSSAWRPQETLTQQVAHSMIQRVNSLPGGPVTGRAFDCAVSTGDNIDNQQQNELDWFFTLLNGGTATPTSGNPTVHEGVQNAKTGPADLTFDDKYWHPDPGTPDFYKSTLGFPDAPGLLEAAIRSFATPGLKLRWFSAYGNHDGLRSGNVVSNTSLDGIATGAVKIVSPPVGVSPGSLTPDNLARPATLTGIAGGIPKAVTADPARIGITSVEWVQAHLDAAGGKGPTGHGYTEENLAPNKLYFTFEVAPGVLGVSLDTTNHTGYADGAIRANQADWLEARLKEVSSRYYDSAGNVVRSGATDQLVVLFSHHNMATIANPGPDLEQTDAALSTAAVEALLHRYPNVVLWVNGHTHVNKVTPFPDASGRTGGYWEINTASHVDYPQQARLVEVADNRDGTLSIFGTLIEHAASPASAGVSNDPIVLASLSRELAANDFQSNLSGMLGEASSRNVELLVKAPFDVASTVQSIIDGTAGAATGAGGSLAATGGGGLVPALGAAALAAGLALRGRRGSE